MDRCPLIADPGAFQKCLISRDFRVNVGELVISLQTHLEAEGEVIYDFF